MKGESRLEISIQFNDVWDWNHKDGYLDDFLFIHCFMK